MTFTLEGGKRAGYINTMTQTLDQSLLELCSARQLRLTPQRLDVLKVLVADGKALGAYQLLEQVKPLHPKLTITSLYRILEFWAQQGLVHKVAGLNAYIACNDPHEEHTHVVMFCDSCGKTIEVCDHKAGFDAASTVGSQGFHQSPNQVVEFRCSCEDCQAAA